MGITDKARNAVQKAAGQAKEKIGDAQGDEQVKAEGQADKVEGSAKQAGENVEDAFR